MRTSTVLCLFSLVFLNFQLYSQIPNGDFEQWTNGEPDGWWTNNSIYTTITQSNDAHGGSRAVKGENVTTNNIGILQPLMISGPVGSHGFPVSEMYVNLTGYYKLHAVGGDNFDVVVAMYKEGQIIAVGGEQFSFASSYTLFTVPIYYSIEDTPDSCQISVTIGNNYGPLNLGTYFIADDFSFQGEVSGIDDNNGIEPNTFALQQNYPNPFNPATNIKYSIPEYSFVSLTVYDVLGNKIQALVSEYKPAGSYEVKFNASDLPSGMYFCRLKAGNLGQVKKMMLLK